MSRIRKPAQASNAGGSSSRAPRSIWDRARFTSRENARWYEEHKGNAIVVEKTISDEVDHTFDLRRAFESIGWGPMVTLTGRYYPRLVGEFFANIEDKEDMGWSRVISHVKGCRIDLDRAGLAQILGIPDEGPDVEFNKNDVLSDRLFKRTEALLRLDCPTQRSSRSGVMVVRTPHMIIPQRLLVYLFSSNVLPRASSLNEVRCSDVYLLDKMLHGLQGIAGVPFASIALFQMKSTVRSRRAAKSLCYPLMLTKIFERFGVDVMGEDIATPGPVDVLTEANLYRMGYVRVLGTWRNLVRDPLLEGEVPDARGAQVADTDDEDAHSEAPHPSALPSTSTGVPPQPSSHASVIAELRQLKDICTGMAGRQEVMEAQLQRQEDQLQQIRALLERYPPPPA